MTYAVHQVLADAVLYGVEKDGYWGYEHSEYPMDDWLLEVGEGCTLQSYHQWVTSQLEEEKHEQNNRCGVGRTNGTPDGVDANQPQQEDAETTVGSSQVLPTTLYK